MDKKAFTQALSQLKESSRKFDQSYEVIINLKNLDLKNQNNHIDLFLTLPKPTGRPIKICALVGRELKDAAAEACDTVIVNDDFAKYDGDKKAIKKLADTHEYFVAQATLMPQVAKTFGRVLGPRGKMPNPKAGCVVPPNANLGPLVDKLKRTVRVQAKKMAVIQAPVGRESVPETDVVENAFALYNQLMHTLPQEQNNIKDVYVKKSMSPAVKLGEKSAPAPAATPKRAPKAAPAEKKASAEEAR